MNVLSHSLYKFLCTIIYLDVLISFPDFLQLGLAKP